MIQKSKSMISGAWSEQSKPACRFTSAVLKEAKAALFART
jgi:hypothetical protein